MILLHKMKKFNSSKGLSIIESLVCLVIIGIGFIAVSQLASFAVSSMDRSMERNKVNFLSEMMMEDIIADPNNTEEYKKFNETCTHNPSNRSPIYDVIKDKWRERLKEQDQIKIGSKYKVPRYVASCDTSKDAKKILVNSTNDRTTTRVNFLTGKGRNKKYLGVVLK